MFQRWELGCTPLPPSSTTLNGEGLMVSLPGDSCAACAQGVPSFVVLVFCSNLRCRPCLLPQIPSVAASHPPLTIRHCLERKGRR
ncbi:hypothetical protein M378DRAFT_549048 [Amanita muscaria Koide BX008]|uniref:Uncharacterized protein n=1 Tax=Amanita muscaria (strain Koide BX008) TaxID=946122 RepID=A0A0C2WHA1_AMAMK|nr:hypothetical protein M378DRAFT_549048 [Amanita muscaria Koide BX008]